MLTSKLMWKVEVVVILDAGAFEIKVYQYYHCKHCGRSPNYYTYLATCRQTPSPERWTFWQ
jgi:hypothetical protein